MQYPLSHNANSYTCTECKGWNVVDDGTAAFIFLRRGAYCMQMSVSADLRKAAHKPSFFFPSYLCLWSVNEAIFVCYLELHWPTEAVLHHFSTLLRDRKSPLPCWFGALPSVLTQAVRTRHFSQGFEDWHPFHFPAWAAQIKGHILNPCANTPAVRRDGFVGRSWAAALTS